MDTHTRARIKREVEYLANRLAREETERHHAKERENEHKFLQLSRNSTLIKSVMALHMKGGTVEGLGVKQLEELRDDYEAVLCDVAEWEGDPVGFFLASNVAGKGAALAEDEEEEEWEMLDRLREEATRQPAMIKQREPPKPAVPAPQASAAGAAAGPRGATNSKTSLVQTIMADKTLSPAERQRKIQAVMGRPE